MKKRQAGILAIFALAMVAAATAADRYDATYAAEGSSLRYFYTPNTIDQNVACNTQDGLVEQDRFGRFVPSLAEKWTVNEDSTVWTFTLRKGLYFVDNKGQKTKYEITADDWIEGLRYVADPKNGIKNLSKDLRQLIVGLNNYYLDLADVDAGKKTDITRDQALANFSKVGISAPDKYTVVYKLTKSTSFFLSYLVMELFLPVDKDFLASVGQDFGTAKDKLIYSGAYYLADWQRDKQIQMKANPFYWDAKAISVKTINLQNVVDPNVTLQMFQRGELSSASLSADQVKALAGTKWADLIYSDPASSSRFSVTYWFDLNFTSANPEFKAFVNNLNFRKALYYGIDRVKLNELDEPNHPADILRNTVVPEQIITDEKGKDYTDYPGVKDFKAAGNVFNKAKAQDYFKKAVAELTDGKGNIKGVQPTKVDMKPIAEFDVDGKLPLKILYVHAPGDSEVKRALLLRAMLEDTFGKENIEIVDGQFINDSFDEVIDPRRFDIIYDNFRFGFADPSAQLGRLITGGGINDGQYSDPEFDKLVAEASAKVKLSDRFAIFAKAEALFLDRVYVMPWQMGGTAYQITKVVPFTYPRGAFGITRFKYKGMKVEDQPITSKRYADLKAAFLKDLDAATK
jgi:oligopeptide transport system substrate-binding protein